MQEDIRLEPLTDADFATVAALADTIWRSHYGTMISMAQIDYMLDGRYTADNLRRYVDASDRWLWLLRVDGDAVGYCSCSLGEQADEMKLEQLYLLPALHGRGLGGRMLRHVEAMCRTQGRDVLWLTVNKGNAGSIAVYRKAGFTVRREAVFDIGHGYVMDDYVMEKRLGA